MAYFLTWTCYGTWLHGDPRGSVDAEHNTPDTPYLKPDGKRAAENCARMSHPAILLTPVARNIVTETIRWHCSIRDWDLRAINVRSNHVHVVLTAPEIPPDHVMLQLKSWTTRRLRESGYVKRNQSVWTEKGSKRQLFTDASLWAAISYVLEQQDER